MTASRKQWRWALPFAAGVLFADFATKETVLASLAHGERIPITGFFNLVFYLNQGAAFSFLADAGGWQMPFLLGLGLTVSVILISFLLRNRMDRWTAIGFAAILGGALGNVAGRARHGAVVDWLDFHLAQHHWPAFNVADIGISVGAAILILASFCVGEKAASFSRGDR